jgi:hypothetical protein
MGCYHENRQRRSETAELKDKARAECCYCPNREARHYKMGSDHLVQEKKCYVIKEKGERGMLFRRK